MLEDDAITIVRQTQKDAIIIVHENSEICSYLRFVFAMPDRCNNNGLGTSGKMQLQLFSQCREDAITIVSSYV